MNKQIVINVRFGGYGVSKAALEYMHKQGCEEAGKEVAEWVDMYNYSRIFSEDRENPLLVAAVLVLGEKANGRFAKLKVVEIPVEVQYTIEEYDGYEHVAEVHQTWG